MMKKKSLALASALLACFCIACNKEGSDREIAALAGVWEGPMTVSDDDVHVKILNISGTTAELMDMKYTFDGYTVTDRKKSSVRILESGDDGLILFKLASGGRGNRYFLEGDIIGDAEGEALFKRTDNTLGHYKNGFASVPGLLPHDKEFTGPSKYAGSPALLSEHSLSFGWTDLLLWVGAGAVRSASGMATSEFLEFIFSGDSASATLDDVLSRIDKIEEMLNSMITLYHNTTYESKLNERSKLQSEMHNYNNETYIRLKNAETEEQAKTVITEWAMRDVGGNPAYVQALNYMDFLLKTVVEQKDIFNMYDLYAYNTIPWEHQGYAYRESLRMGDIACVAESLFLTQYFQMVREGVDEKSRKEILAGNAEKFKNFSDFVEKHPVVHHENLAICQIPGAHLAMERQSFSYPDFRDPSWCRLPARWTRWTSDEYFMWGPDQAENYSQAISWSEMSAMMLYYAGKKNVYEILTDEAGCEMREDTKPGSGKRGALCLQGGYFPGDWREIGLSCVALTSAAAPYQIEPLSAGRAVIDGAGIFAQYLEFYKWDKFYDDIVWIRTKVVER